MKFELQLPNPEGLILRLKVPLRNGWKGRNRDEIGWTACWNVKK